MTAGVERAAIRISISRVEIVEARSTCR